MSQRLNVWRERVVALVRTRPLTLLLVGGTILFFAVGSEVKNIRQTEPDVFSPQQDRLVHPKAITYSDSRLPLHVAMPVIAPRADTLWRGVARVVSGILNETLLRNITVHVVTDAFDAEPDSDRRRQAIAKVTGLRHARLRFEVYRLCDLIVEAALGASTCSAAPQALPGSRAFSRLLRHFSATLPVGESERADVQAEFVRGLLGPYAFRWLGAPDAAGAPNAHEAPGDTAPSPSSPVLPDVALFVDPVGLRVAGDAWDMVTTHVPRMHDANALVGLASDEGTAVVNAAVQLLDLRSMRLTPAYSAWLARFNISRGGANASSSAATADPARDTASFLYTRLAHDYAPWVHRFGCEWNRQPLCVRKQAPARAAPLPSVAEQLRGLCPRPVYFLYSPSVAASDASVAATRRFSPSPGCASYASAPEASSGPALQLSHRVFEAAAIAALPSVGALDAVQADPHAARWALSAVFERRQNLTRVA